VEITGEGWTTTLMAPTGQWIYYWSAWWFWDVYFPNWHYRTQKNYWYWWWGWYRWYWYGYDTIDIDLELKSATVGVKSAELEVGYSNTRIVVGSFTGDANNVELSSFEDEFGTIFRYIEHSGTTTFSLTGEVAEPDVAVASVQKLADNEMPSDPFWRTALRFLTGEPQEAIAEGGGTLGPVRKGQSDTGTVCVENVGKVFANNATFKAEDHCEVGSISYLAAKSTDIKADPVEAGSKVCASVTCACDIDDGTVSDTLTFKYQQSEIPDDFATRTNVATIECDPGFCGDNSTEYHVPSYVEECDNGNKGDSQHTTKNKNGTQSYNGKDYNRADGFCLSTCKDAYCGDGIPNKKDVNGQGGEECDDGVGNHPPDPALSIQTGCSLGCTKN